MNNGNEQRIIGIVNRLTKENKALHAQLSAVQSFLAVVAQKHFKDIIVLTERDINDTQKRYCDIDIAIDRQTGTATIRAIKRPDQPEEPKIIVLG